MFTLSHVAQVSSVCLHFHPWSSACALVLECSLFTPSLYFFLKSFFHLFLIPAMVPDENSMEDPLCNSSFGSMVSLDYVTPDTSLPPLHDSFPDAGEAINDFWFMSGSFICRHHVEPRVKLYSPREESFPIPLMYIDVIRTTYEFVC